jgi:transposase-like protein
MTSTQVEVITSVERRSAQTEKERLVLASLQPGAMVSAIAPAENARRSAKHQRPRVHGDETPVPLKLTRHSLVASFWCDREAC